MENKLELCRKKLFASRLKKGIEFKGYEVYEPVYNQPFFGGFSKIVLVKNGEVKLSSIEDYFEYMNFKKSKS